MEKNNVLKIDGYEFSENQKNLWLIRNGSLETFSNQILIEFKEGVDSHLLLRAIKLVIQRHKILSFKINFDKNYIFPIQFSSKQFNLDYHEIEIVNVDDNINYEKKMDYPYDPSINQPIRFCLVKVCGEVKYLHIKLYALWGDNYSCLFFSNELFEAISHLEIYEKEEIEKIDYIDFGAWQNELLNDPEEEACHFWRTYNHVIEKKILPFSIESNVFVPKRKQIYLAKTDEYINLKKSCIEIEIELSDFFLLQFANYLSLFTDEEITLGYIPYKRNYEDLNNTIGLVNKTLPIKFNRSRDLTMKEKSIQLRKKMDQVEAWSDYFSVDRKNNLEEVNKTSFKYCFEFIDINENYEKEISSKKFQIKDVYSVQDLFELKVCCVDYGNEISVELYYDESKFKDCDISLIEAQINMFFKNTSNQNQNYNDLSLFEQDILEKSNNTNKEFKFHSIINLFESQVKNYPNNIAIVHNNKQITYQELNTKSNQFANYLLNIIELKRGEPICVLLEPSNLFIISIIGILKAGGYFIPIDQEYPKERIQFILNDCNCKFVISSPELFDKYDFYGIDVINPSNVKINEVASHKCYVNTKRDDIAYCIYTSGSTGNPKGCLINHGNLFNYIQWSNDFYFGNTNLGNWGLITSVSFDLTITCLFTSITRGKKLWIGDVKKDISILLKESFCNEHIDTLKLTPAHLNLLKELHIKETNISTIILGGEQLIKKQLDVLWNLNDNIRIFNEYGPTESTVGCVVKQIYKEDEKIIIGKPIANTKIRILNDDCQPCKIGVSGEIFIEGAGVSIGYLNNPNLTEEKFIQDQFFKKERLYRSGDLGRWLSDGNIEFIGRKDDQVKIRGHRIELLGIENQLLNNKDIVEAIAVVLEINILEKEIAVYFVSHKKLNVTDLRLFLKKRLPDYMIPSHFIQLNKLPLTINGKVDKKYLTHLDINSTLSDVEYIAPRNEIEEKIINIWQNILQKEKIGIKDDFFFLGGHSIKAIRVINEYHKAFNVKLSLKDFFDNTTLESHTNLIKIVSKSYFIEIDKIAQSQNYPLSNSQKRIWILSQFEEASVAYNIPTYIELDGDYDIESFKKAVDDVIERHEILRTIFKYDESEILKQWVLTRDELGFKVDYYDLRDCQDKEEKFKSYFVEDSKKMFNLEKGPLFRASLFCMSDEKYVFYYNMHHIITDGWSMNVLSNDILAYYNNYTKSTNIKLPLLRIQYKDYAYWQISQLNKVEYIKHQDYWLRSLNGQLPLLELPSRKLRPKVKTYNGSCLSTFISCEVTNRLKSFNQDQGGSLFIGLLATWNILFYRYTSQKDIILGSPILGRDHKDLENQIGFYVNTLAFRNVIDPNDSFVYHYDKVKQSTLEAYLHQSYPFDKILEDLELKRDTSRSPVFDIMLVLQNIGEKIENDVLSDEIDKISKADISVSKFDIEIIFHEIGDNLYFKINYNSDVYETEMIEGLIKHYKQLLSEVLDNPNEKIFKINYLDDKEKELILNIYNDTEENCLNNKTIIELFEKQVQDNPNNIAIFFEEKAITYSNLNGLSNQLANYLKENYEIVQDDLVGIKLDRSEWMVIAILAVLKSGSAYIPIDVEYPKERIDYIMQDSNLKISIDDEELCKFVQQKDLYSKDNLGVEILKNNLAYVIYTSGSTGQPKGVMIEHGSLSNYLHWSLSTYLDSSSNAYFGLFSSLSFDLTITSLFLPLINGNTLTVFGSNVSLIDTLRDYFESGISSVKLTPAHIDIMGSNNIYPINIELAIIGGDILNYRHVEILRKNNPLIKIYNEYGPTESTVGCIVYEVTPLDKNILIGQPIRNTKVYILTEDMELVPHGVVGELCISGLGLARGYLNKLELTTEKFVTNPFTEGERLYRTGDLTRRLVDGNIEFLGRLDDQVKINGFRIELGEIENTILLYSENLKQVVVQVKEVKEEKVLVAYLVSSNTIDKSDLRGFLQENLPYYMIPSFYLLIKSIPLTPNGKLDKIALPSISETDIIRKEYIAPCNKAEEILVSIWEEVLQIEKIGVTDNFFELGGNSLNALKVWSKMKELKKYNIKLNELYNFPTIQKLCQFKNNKTLLIDFNQISENKETSIYFIPPITGISSVFKKLSTIIESKANCHGFEYLGLNDGDEFFKSIEEASQMFCKEIIARHQDCSSNIIIFGYSMGGSIAFEMIKTLESIYKNVTLVLTESYINQNSNDYQENIVEKNINESLEIIETYAKQNKINFNQNLVNYINNNNNIFNNYFQKGKINSNIYLFQSNESSKNMLEWENFTNGSIKIYGIMGNHWEAMSEFNNEIYAKKLVELSSCLLIS